MTHWFICSHSLTRTIDTSCGHVIWIWCHRVFYLLFISRFQCYQMWSSFGCVCWYNCCRSGCCPIVWFCVVGASLDSSLWSLRLSREDLSSQISPPSLKKLRNCFLGVVSCRLSRWVDLGKETNWSDVGRTFSLPGAYFWCYQGLNLIRKWSEWTQMTSILFYICGLEGERGRR